MSWKGEFIIYKQFVYIIYNNKKLGDETNGSVKDYLLSFYGECTDKWCAHCKYWVDNPIGFIHCYIKDINSIYNVLQIKDWTDLDA